MAKLSDRIMLEILDRHERLGLTLEIAGAPFRMTRSAVSGVVSRVRIDTNASDRVQLAVKPENRDGGMPEKWWTKGLVRQERV